MSHREHEVVMFAWLQPRPTNARREPILVTDLDYRKARMRPGALVQTKREISIRCADGGYLSAERDKPLTTE